MKKLWWNGEPCTTSEVALDYSSSRIMEWIASHAAKEDCIALKPFGKGVLEIPVLKGQIVLSSRLLGAELKINESTIDRRLKRLEVFGLISIQPRNLYSIITLL